MKAPEIPVNEQERQNTLNELNILDTLEEQSYDDLTLLAAKICNSPISLVSLIDKDRQWFKSHYGLEARETPREYAFCAHAIHHDELFYIPDSEKDERFSDNPLVTNEPYVKFYAGVPLKVKNHNVGTLCVIDNQPKELTEEQKILLAAIARQVETQLDLRLKIKELNSLDDLKNNFIAMVSHELKTPLTTIKASMPLLTKDIIESNAQNTQLYTSIQNNIGRLEDMINEILDASKIESNNLELNKTKQNINKTIEKTLSLMNNYFINCNVEVTQNLNDRIQDNLFDEPRIIQILTNLLSNAAKYSPENSKITIKSEDSDDVIMIKVIDEGAGIPAEEVDLLFQKFSNINNKTSNKTISHGLGLYISKQLAEIHDGTILYEPNQPSGSIFTVLLPKSS